MGFENFNLFGFQNLLTRIGEEQKATTLNRGIFGITSASERAILKGLFVLKYSKCVVASQL